MHVIFEPLDFIARLAALVPKPPVHLIRVHGVFAPKSKHRVSVTLAKRSKGNKPKAVGELQERLPVEHRASMSWPQRLRRSFNIDIEDCREHGDAVKFTACIEGPVVIRQILDHLKHKAETSESRSSLACPACPRAFVPALFVQHLDRLRHRALGQAKVLGNGLRRIGISVALREIVRRFELHRTPPLGMTGSTHIGAQQVVQAFDDVMDGFTGGQIPEFSM